jgi:hypothetical protein
MRITIRTGSAPIGVRGTVIAYNPKAPALAVFMTATLDLLLGPPGKQVKQLSFTLGDQPNAIVDTTFGLIWIVENGRN